MRPVWADSPEVSLFYDALAPDGNWVDYGKYGPVWVPYQGVIILASLSGRPLDAQPQRLGL